MILIAKKKSKTATWPYFKKVIPFLHSLWESRLLSLLLLLLLLLPSCSSCSCSCSCPSSYSSYYTTIKHHSALSALSAPSALSKNQISQPPRTPIHLPICQRKPCQRPEKNIQRGESGCANMLIRPEAEKKGKRRRRSEKRQAFPIGYVSLCRSLRIFCSAEARESYKKVAV